MNLSFRHFALFSVLAAALFGARSVPISRVPESGRLVLERPVLPAPVRNTRWQEQALLFAGRPLPPESPFYELSLCPSFRRHAEAMELFWDQVRKDSLNAMISWRERNVPRDLVRNPVLYPLSGADYLNAYALFPHAPQYTFIALEAPGTLPDLYRMTEPEREAGLAAIRRAVATVASVNYMKSKILRKELSNSYIPGTLPVFLLLAGGLGHIVEDVRPVILDETGNIRDSQWGSENPAPQRSRKPGAANVIHGLRMMVRDPETRQTKIIVYLQVRLRKEAVSTATREGKFLSRIHNCNTIFKAAVYLLHNDEYDAVREFVLDRSDLILQDDSGLPYRLFRPDEWVEHLFGTYTRIPPLGGIPDPPQQPVLARRFREHSEPLFFPYGYGVLQGKGKSNLMLFVKKSLHTGLH
jgi:hypothetical protein